MNTLFNAVGMPRIPANSFDLSHEHKTSFDIGELVPTCVFDCLPGDIYRFTPEQMFRMAPMIAPVMHTMEAYTHYFFVPYRILWPGFEDFITGNDPDIVAPFFILDSGHAFDSGCIADYMGIPPLSPSGGNTFEISPFYFAAYRMIYDEYYRDQNLIPTELFVPLLPGDNSLFYGAGSFSKITPMCQNSRPSRKSPETREGMDLYSA